MAETCVMHGEAVPYETPEHGTREPHCTCPTLPKKSFGDEILAKNEGDPCENCHTSYATCTRNLAAKGACCSRCKFTDTHNERPKAKEADMDFLEFMNLMFEVKRKVPGMIWGVEDGTVVLRLPVGSETVALLDDAKAMFS